MRDNETLPSTGDLLLELHRLTQGLWYVSETDAPLEVIQFPSPSEMEPSDAELTAWVGKPADEKVETVELAYFFRNMTRESAEATEEERRDALRYQELQRFLEQQLEGAKVYRIGQRKVTALILGKFPNGDWAGIRTSLIET